MWFDASAKLAEIERSTPAILAIPANLGNETPLPTSRLASLVGSEGQKPGPARAPAPPPDREFCHGFGAGDLPLTWAGNVVSLADWRKLSAWEKHGPDGKHWNGQTGQWEPPL